MKERKPVKKESDLTLKLKRKIFIYSIIEVVLVAALLGFIMFLIMVLMN
ncbi:hypothetical protein [Carboxylicivirga sp. N1Y90]|nr:hypothetical protein [Marinilabiliaceae bacterium N1Y90]